MKILNLPFNSDGVEEYATFEASFDEYKGINEALLVFLWEHVFELEEEIVELVLQWHSARRVIVSQTELAQDAWVAHLH